MSPSLQAFRARSIRTARYVAGAAVASGLLASWRAELGADAALLVPAGALAVSVAVLWVARRSLTGRRASVALTLWAALGILAVLTVALIPGALLLALYWSLVLISISALLAPPLEHAIVTASVILANVLGSVIGTGEPLTSVFLQAAALGIVGALASLASAELRAQSAARASLLVELQRRDVAFERLYEVLTTLTAGSSLRLVLPELVGRIGRYFRAQVGLVVLHEHSGLEVVSPIWTAGYSLEIDRYVLPLTGSGEIEQVFKSGSPGLYHDLTEDPDTHSILGELGVRTAMCAPLRVENRTIGVLVLADKEWGEFDESDLEALVSLSGPAALVVAQLERIEEAAESTRRMEDLARMKSDFVSVVSHELRTPLTSIIGSLATLSRPGLAPETEQGRELLASARGQADRLGRLIEDLLTASRIEHGALHRVPQEIVLLPFLEEIVATIPSQNRSISVRVEEGATELVADPDHLSRIVINLVENAIKYAGSSPIEIVAARDRGRTAISVIDHGSGIRLQERDRAFERFTQLEPAQTRSRGGAGLGLSIVQGLIQAMGGSLELTDTPGGGATFIVYLPTRVHHDPTPLATSPVR